MPKHHYVPICHMRKFTNSVYVRHQNNTTKILPNTNLTKIACQNHLYSDKLEETLSTIEGIYNIYYNKTLTHLTNPTSELDEETLKFWLCYQQTLKLRNPEVYNTNPQNTETQLFNLIKNWKTTTPTHHIRFIKTINPCKLLFNQPVTSIGDIEIVPLNQHLLLITYPTTSTNKYSDRELETLYTQKLENTINILQNKQLLIPT